MKSPTNASMLRVKFSTTILVVSSAAIAMMCSATSVFAQLSAEDEKRAREYFINGTTLQLQGNRHAEAILEFQEALRIDSSSATLAAMARSYAELRKLDRAEETVRAALRLNEKSRDSWELLAEILVASGNYDAGVEAYEKVLDLEPTTRQLFTLGRLYEQRDPEKAVEVFEDLAEKTNDPNLYLRLAALYTRTRNLDGVISNLQKAYELAPDNPEVASSLIEAYINRGELQQAVTLSKQQSAQRVGAGRARQVWTSLLQNILADSLLANLNRRIVQEVVDESMRNYEYSFAMLTAAGTLALVIDDIGRAQASFNAAAQVVETRPDQLLQIGAQYLQSNLPSVAIEFMQTWQPRHPSDPRFLLLIADSYQLLDEPTKAIAYFRTATDIDDRIVYAWANLGVLYDAVGLHDSSDHAYEQVLYLDPLDMFVNNNYAYSLAVRGTQLEKAKRLSWTALQQDPNNAAYLDTYAWILYQLGDYSAAEMYINKAISSGGNATHHEHLGFILEKLGNLDGAVRAWEFAIELDEDRKYLRSSIDRYR